MFFPYPLAHKLWILDCRACGSFLTNRGMKAVLLLHPNVSLFSTDALPINCSAYSSNPLALRPPSFSSSPSRTCDCLTQTLCCHRCGNAVGYAIVIPCTRCTSSITATHRVTNGHRFVFHSTELIATERHYIQGEPGVIPYHFPFPHTTPSVRQPQLFYASPHSIRSTSPRAVLIPSLYTNPNSTPSSPGSEYFTTPLLELTDVPSSSDGFPFHHTHTSSPQHSPRALSIQPHPFVPSQGPPYSLVPTEHKDPPPAQPLRPGDVLFWHNLARNGEIPGVEEDPRARDRAAAANTPTFGR